MGFCCGVNDIFLRAFKGVWVIGYLFTGVLNEV